MELELTNSMDLTKVEEPKANVFIFDRKENIDSKELSNAANITKGENRNSGISLSKSLMARIDAVKHPDIPRSRFVQRILEAALLQQEQNHIK